MKVGFAGYRGMVGSVLLERMLKEGDFKHIETHFLSTSQAGKKAPAIDGANPVLGDAKDIELLSKMDVILTCQGGDYTGEVYPALRKSGWEGVWIDAASTLRMEKDAIIVLDPVNRSVINQALANGIKSFIGGNCTVSLMLMGLGGLFREGLVEWMSTMTYQSASGAGAAAMEELMVQMKQLGDAALPSIENPSASAVQLERSVYAKLQDPSLPADNFGVPLAASLIPWIDRAMPDGDTREEWKGMAETNKILGNIDRPIPIDGLCVRVGALRCHSQAITVKLKKDVPLTDLEGIIGSANDWVRFVKNEKEQTLKELTPAAVSGKMDIPVGRLRKMRMGPEYLAAFTVGDQLLWGAAEPLRRMLRILIESK